ncbi:MAG: GNAT family N-acetyltransferase [Thiotrichaceae bacterium]|nr:GNAT family N-acetyltransferase [Thiotrichaceae bacterium]
MYKTSAYNVVLREVLESDIEQLRLWRNCPEIRNNMLSSSIITKEEQKQWFDSLALKNEFHFVAEYQNKPLGYANYKPDNKGKGGQTSIYVGEEKYRNTIIPFFIVLALLDFIFIEQHENQVAYLDACIFQHNKKAIRFNEKLGYQFNKQEDDLIWMRLSKENYLLIREEFQKLNK